MKTGQSDASYSTSGPNRKILGLPTWFWPALFIVLATVAAYWPVFSAGYIWDDDAYVTDNTLLSAPDGWSRIWFSAHTQSQYFPLVYSTLRLEYALWGLHPMGYHVVNVCVHIVNALLVWALLSRLALPRAWLVAAVFALHPVQVETVAWVTELKNTESTLFYLLALFAWLRFCAGKDYRFYALTLVLFALALFAKTTACTMPAALLLLVWLKREPMDWRRILQMAPFLVIGFGMGLVSIWWESHLGNYKPHYHLLEGPLDRLLIATRALWFYAGKDFWPANLTFSYPHWEIDVKDPAQYVWLAACVGVAALAWWGREKLGRAGVVAIVFFAAALSPMLGFIPLYTFYFSYVADHYQYFACLGMIGLGLGLAAKVLERARANRHLQAALAGLLLAVLGLLTWKQCAVYRTAQTLWEDTLKKNPRSWMAHTNLGRLLAEQDDTAGAEQQYLAAIAINPDEENSHYNYANLLARTKRYDEAIEQYRLSINVAPGKPETHNNLGFVLNHEHHTDEAIAEYELAIFYKPDYADAYYNLGNALSMEHKMDAAITAYQQALRLEPDSERFKKRLQALGVAAQ